MAIISPKKLCQSVLVLTISSTFLFFQNGCRANEMFSLDGHHLLSGTTATKTDEGLKVTFGTKDAWPNIAWRPDNANGWDWSPYEALVLTIANPGAVDAPFHVKITDETATGHRHSTQLSGRAVAGQTERFFVSLQSRSLRKKSGMRNLPPLKGDFGTLIGSGVEPGHIDELQIFLSRPKEPKTLLIKAINLEGESKALDLNGLVDKYGQYTREDWPGKARSDADLLSQKTAEDADLKAHPPTNNLDKWGGSTNAPRQKATGFFRTAQVNGKWWLVDPDGYLFLSVGIDVVRPDLSTTVTGRDFMFTNLDPKYFSKDKSTYNFGAANMDIKYGADNTATAFGDRAIKRLQSWGFNTLGNWTPEKLGQEHQFPYVVAVGTKGGFATVSGHNGNAMPDPFDPAFAVDVEKNLAPKAALAKNDAAVVGYFFDNELPWGSPGIDSEHYVLCWGTLELGENSPAKRAFIGLLKTRYTSIALLNAAWKTNFASFDALNEPYKTSASIKSEAQRADFSAFLSLYADQYFQIVSSAVKKDDPNHLYLGCRFAYWFTPEAVKASAKYVDVISFNIYNWNPKTYAFAQQLGKPCIVGEFHFGASDRGMFSGDITVKDQAARAQDYFNYVKEVLSEPAFVGCHWFQYYDEPTTGRSHDGENFNIGFLSITDAPYPELISAARDANKQIYQWHAATKSGQ